MYSTENNKQLFYSFLLFESEKYLDKNRKMWLEGIRIIFIINIFKENPKHFHTTLTKIDISTDSYQC